MQLSKQAAYAPGTKLNFVSKLKTFLLFCLYFSLEILPVSELTLCLYAQFLSRTFHSVSAIKAYVQAIKSLHEHIGASVSSFSGYQLKITLRGLARLLRKPPAQARPFTPQMLLDIHKGLAFSNLEDMVFWSILLTGFFSFARVSNLIQTNVNDFHLRRSQVKITGEVMLLVFPKTKTIQFGERVLKVPLVAIAGSPMCPVSAYQRMIAAIPAPAGAAAFSYLKSGMLKPYTYAKFQRKLKDSVRKLGKNPRLYSSHSMRRGGASTAFKAGAPGEVVRSQGDWATDSYLSYLRFPHTTRLSLAESMAASISKDHNG